MQSIILHIELLGTLKKFGNNHTLKISIPKGSKLVDIRNTVKSLLVNNDLNFSDHELVEKSVLANESRILNVDELFEDDMHLVMLPPVCGG